MTRKKMNETVSLQTWNPWGNAESKFISQGMNTDSQHYIRVARKKSLTSFVVKWSWDLLVFRNLWLEGHFQENWPLFEVTRIVTCMYCIGNMQEMSQWKESWDTWAEGDFTEMNASNCCCCCAATDSTFYDWASPEWCCSHYPKHLCNSGFWESVGEFMDGGHCFLCVFNGA